MCWADWKNQASTTRLFAFPLWTKTINLSAEEVHTTEYYRELRTETDESIWCAEYMQEPIEAKGLLFPKSELMRFKRADIIGKGASGTHRSV